MAKQILPNGIGNIVMYSLSTDISVPIQDVLAQASANNIPPVLLPPPQNDKGAFQKACTEVAVNMTAKTGNPCVRKMIAEDDQYLTVVFEMRMPDTDDDVQSAIAGNDYVPTYPPILRINYDKVAGKIDNSRVYKEVGRSVLGRVERRFNAMKTTYTIKQMRASIQSAFDYYGTIKLRHNGGVNFVPHTRIKDWRNYTNFIESFEGVQIMELSVGNTAHNKNTVRDALSVSVNDTLEDEIKRLGGKCNGSKELNELVADFSKALKDYSAQKMTATKHQMLEGMLARFKATMLNVDAYKVLLNADLSSIDSQVDIAKQQLMALINKVNGVEGGEA